MAWGGDWHQPRSGPGHVTSLGPASWGHGTGGIICVSRCHTGGGGESLHSHYNSLTDMAWGTWASAHTQPLVSVISWPHMVLGARSWPQSHASHVSVPGSQGWLGSAGWCPLLRAGVATGWEWVPGPHSLPSTLSLSPPAEPGQPRPGGAGLCSPRPQSLAWPGSPSHS